MSRNHAADAERRATESEIQKAIGLRPINAGRHLPQGAPRPNPKPFDFSESFVRDSDRSAQRLRLRRRGFQTPPTITGGVRPAGA